MQKFLIRDLLEQRIRELRAKAVASAYQETLFGEDRDRRVTVSDDFPFRFHSQAYAPSRVYGPQASAYGYFDFRRHYYGRIGDFDSKEEFECATWMDIQAQKGRIRFWVRSRDACSFFLQKADGRFYPDFLCVLPGEKIVAVECKGADRSLLAEGDRRIGGVWAELSAGRCRFVMVKEKRWDGIEDTL